MIRRGWIQAALYDLGPYPAIGFGDDPVLGEVWTLNQAEMDETLRVLDDVEGYTPGGLGNEYERVVETATLEDGSTIEVYVYRFAVTARLTRFRRIRPFVQVNTVLCAAWPDAFSKVPTALNEEKYQESPEFPKD
jgi:gamma-glutamylcyclotransferase (GGCT)/AIG2-like uncharacterized protein YtfP